MKKNIFKLFTLLTFLIIFALPVKAENYKLEIVDKGKINSIGLNGEKFHKEIIDEDLDKGTFKIKLTFDNTDYTEVFFVVDNSTAMTDTIKTSVITSLKELAEEIEENNVNVKIGSIAINDNDEKTITNLSDEVSTIKTGLDNIGSKTAGGANHVSSAIKTATDSFSSKNVNRVIIIVTASKMDVNELSVDNFKALGNLEDESKCDINGCATSGNTDFVTVAINLDSDEETKSYFTSPAGSILKTVTDAEIATGIKTDAYNGFVKSLPTAKKDVTITDNFPSVILDNFKIEGAETETGSIEATDTSLVWKVTNDKLLEREEIVTLTYSVKLNDKIDKDFIDKVLNLNSDSAPVGITYNYTGTSLLPKGSGVFTADCTPKIKILVGNPKTGVVNYTISGIVLITVAVVALYVAKKSKQFDTI